LLHVQQNNIKVVGIAFLEQSLDPRHRVHARSFVGGHLRHQPVILARNPAERDAQHAMHVRVSLGRLEKANAAIVSVTHQPVEALLAEIALHLAVMRAGAESQPRHLHSGLPQRDPVGRLRSLRLQRKRLYTRQRACG
jgi:hypothetical protein